MATAARQLNKCTRAMDRHGDRVLNNKLLTWRNHYDYTEKSQRRPEQVAAAQ